MKKHSFRTIAKLAAIAAISAMGFIDSTNAYAGSDSSSMEITASVSANCTISAAPLSFGAYDPVSTNASSPLDASGSLTVQCTQGASASIVLSQGSDADAGSSDSSPMRRLADGAGNHLSYSLFSDAGHSSAWGNTELTGVGHTGTGSAVAISVFGSIAAGQNVPSGSYSDTVLATVNF
jgi:spore coat protein U-like protein